jgi:hypothetical protein
MYCTFTLIKHHDEQNNGFNNHLLHTQGYDLSKDWFCIVKSTLANKCTKPFLNLINSHLFSS